MKLVELVEEILDNLNLKNLQICECEAEKFISKLEIENDRNF